MADVAFLEPWRHALHALVYFNDNDELVAGTLHDSLRCVRLDLCHLPMVYDEHEEEIGVDNAQPFHVWQRAVYDEHEEEIGVDNAQPFHVWQRAYLVQLREALELIGLALHYHKRAWAWLYAADADDFEYGNTDALEPHFELAFHDYDRGDDAADFDNGVAILTRVEFDMLSDEYHAAKTRLQAIAGDAFDSYYRVPVSFVLAPDKSLHDVDGWCASIRALVQSVRAPAFVATSCFEFVGFILYIWRLRIDEPIATLLSELRHAQIRILEITLQFTGARGISSGQVTNLVCGLGPVHSGVATRLVDELSIHESDLRPFIRACTSLMQARSPTKLLMYDAFGLDDVERALKWAWLGYALSGDHIWPTSIHHLRVEDEVLSTSDMQQFSGVATDITQYGSSWDVARPPSCHVHDRKRCVQIAADAIVLVAGQSWQRLGDLGMSDDETFLVIGDDANGGTMNILAPGFGICKIKCESVVDAFEMPRSSAKRFALTSLQCGVNRCEPEALQLLSHTIGSTLMRLKLCLKTATQLEEPAAAAFASAFPVLQFLDLNHVSLGSMDPLLLAYEERTCQVEVLSLTNSFVDPDSMTRFARRLSNTSARVFQCLREFRYVFEDDHDSAHGTCPAIITARAASAFCDALRVNRLLTFLDIGLVKPVYDECADPLGDFDGMTVSDLSTDSKVAFLSVCGPTTRHRTDKKRKQVQWRLPVLPTTIITSVWSFMKPPATRVVSAICVPRR